MTDLQFNLEFECEYGAVVRVADGLRRVVARNPGPFTFKGTGTYIIGDGKVAVIDAGPDIPEHAEAVLAAVRGETVTHQLVTHTHRDHSPAARAVKQATGAETHAFGPHGSGRFEKTAQVEEGGDMDFDPDHRVRDGDVIEGDGWSVECVYTPGHTSNHICFAWRERNILFSGDHVMGWSTTVISPPDGDMASYMGSLARLLRREDAAYYPTHGAPIPNPKPFVAGLIAHRRNRERQIKDCVAEGLTTIEQMVPKMYKGLNPVLFGAAGRSVFAHIIEMVERGDMAVDGELRLDGDFRLE